MMTHMWRCSLALKRAGFVTAVATSGSQALAMWRDDIDLLLTDCVMPDLQGYELASRLRERKPDLKVIFMSGNTVESIEGGNTWKEGVNFLQKPFELGELIQLVAHALGALP
jgi:two-component system cell cycle sensor histidine kinase/response regulator CckA